jgi:1,4-alpha-glucan branching enzyme
MISTTAPRAADAVLVTFTVSAVEKPETQISVVGDFNGWNPLATPMDRRDSGHTATVCLEPGRRYKFRYLTEDGRWFNDEAADAYEPNEHGGLDGVVDLTGTCFGETSPTPDGP